MVDVLNVELRETRGSRNAKRLRDSGCIPAILYGHGKGSVSLAVGTEELEGTIRQGGKFVELKGALSESALISEVQWDAYGLSVLHVDLTRASAGESAQVTVPVTLKGTAPGIRAGGVVEHLQHSVELECPVTAIPDHIEVNVNKLELTDTIHIKDLNLPEGSRALADPEVIVVQCIEAKEELDEDALLDMSSEPEVIGRKADEDGES